jgi:Na+-transporting methylmalonyl-CoA/oxaloacetate decarboxylase gamma subunit
MPNRHILGVVVLLLIVSLWGCGKSAEQQEKERVAREAAVQKAIAASVAEERAKDQRMLDAAAADARERIAREQQRNQELDQAAAKDAVALSAQALVEQRRAADAGAVRIYTDKLRYSLRDPASVETRDAQLSPNRNGLCAEFNAKDKNGRFMGFKRVVVTDKGVAPEEPPVRETLTQFLVFQIAARDTGCFPDVQQLKITQ